MESQIKLRLEVIPDEPTDAETKQALLEKECKSLIKAAHEMGVRANLAEVPAPEGTRGIDIVLGTIILTPIVAESVRWLFEYLKGRAKSRRSCYKVIVTKDGENKTIEIRAADFPEEKIKKLIEEIG